MRCYCREQIRTRGNSGEKNRRLHGDADIAARAGAPRTKRGKDQLMGVTVMFSCAGVDVARFNRFVAEELKPTYADWGQKLDDSNHG